jgi:hypothetical protein
MTQMSLGGWRAFFQPMNIVAPKNHADASAFLAHRDLARVSKVYKSLISGFDNRGFRVWADCTDIA